MSADSFPEQRLRIELSNLKLDPRSSRRETRSSKVSRIESRVSRIEMRVTVNLPLCGTVWRVRDKRVWVNLIVVVNELTIRGISLIVPSLYLQGQSNVHLRDYDPEIFDDDDFYHQV